ncbi:TcpQ domain-containing protein [Billgrantia desiderata]|uniref:PFGI-1 class ICE element type IV pilus protein PilL2 n=1 Tax=Billgrantia desiderata TaxID=52021 RepID=UPI00089F21B8|nr:TcpQ domain-containing protein [Halomonas desiderata]SEG30618.1 type IV pili sensor histidine kinase and response regulator [Halomonas desiderata]
MPSVYDRELEPVEVLRTGRYQLRTASASLGQRRLLEQTVDVQIPPSVSATVGDALDYVLEHTGYERCEPRVTAQRWLYSRPLPGAHYQIGPMPLREALQTVAGESWELDADHITRTVCFEPLEEIRFAREPTSDRRFSTLSSQAHGGADWGSVEGGTTAVQSMPLLASSSPVSSTPLDSLAAGDGTHTTIVTSAVGDNSEERNAGSDGPARTALEAIERARVRAAATSAGESAAGAFPGADADSSSASAVIVSEYVATDNGSGVSTSGADADDDIRTIDITGTAPASRTEPASAPIQYWDIPAGQSLEEGLSAWAEREGWQLVWKSRVNYRIASRVSFTGSIEDAVEELILLYSHAERPLYADISPRQQLVVIASDPEDLGE